MESTKVFTKNGMWEVLKKGDAILIVDSEGRARHESVDHIMVAVHLALQLAEHELPNEPNADEALRERVKRFSEV